MTTLQTFELNVKWMHSAVRKWRKVNTAPFSDRTSKHKLKINAVLSRPITKQHLEKNHSYSMGYLFVCVCWWVSEGVLECMLQ